MSFLSIAFLAALPLAAAPILLHLFDRRRSVVIEWGAMQFLQEAARQKTSARRLQHWLLLLLRVAAVLALVLALARPLIPGNWFGAAHRRETILVLDTSLSTLRQHGDRSAFEGLIERAKQVVDDLGPDDSARLLVSSPAPTWKSTSRAAAGSASRAALRVQLESVRPTHAPGDLLATLMKAVQSDLEDATLAERRIVLLTDGQRTDWSTQDLSGWTRFRQLLEEAHVPTRVEIIEPEADDTPVVNVAVNRLRTPRSIVGPGQPVAITAAVQNYSSRPSPAGQLVWSVDGAVQREIPIAELDPGEVRDVTWSHAFESVGHATVSGRAIIDDQLEADNAASLVFEVVERVPILLVESAGELAEIQQDAYLVQAALGRVESEPSQGWQAVYEPRVVAPERLDSLDLKEFHAVVIPNFGTLSRAAATRLSDYVSAGGGLWIALGPRADVPQFNQLFFNHGGGLSPLAVGESVDESSEGTRRTAINPFRKDHPATRELTDHERLDLGDVLVSRRFPFQLSDDEQDVSVLLELTNGAPLVVENRFGEGRVIVQAIPLRLQWSRLAASQAFVVMVHDWLGYLSEPSGTRHNLLPGDPLSVRVAGLDHADAVLSLPDGNDIVLSGEPVDDGFEFRTSRTTLPGNYRLEFGLAGDSLAFQVARDASESDLSLLTNSDRSFLSDTVGLGRDGGTSTSAGTGRKDPIWQVLLVVLVVVMTGELLLSGAIANKRFGVDSISETAEGWATQADRSPQGGGPPAVQTAVGGRAIQPTESTAVRAR